MSKRGWTICGLALLLILGGCGKSDQQAKTPPANQTAPQSAPSAPTAPTNPSTSDAPATPPTAPAEPATPPAGGNNGSSQ
jgi:hypothetical protein